MIFRVVKETKHPRTALAWLRLREIGSNYISFEREWFEEG